jgi:hypothetical protein
VVTLIFGNLWDAPVCDDAVRVPTPDVCCLNCSERIIGGDAGFITPTYAERMEPKYIVDGRGTRLLTATHRECSLIQYVGHMVGVCACTDWDPQSREAALECQRRVDDGALNRL